MTAPARFDTLRLADRLGTVGFSGEQSHVLIDVLSEALAVDTATKKDVETLRLDLEAVNIHLQRDLAETRAQLDAKIEATRAQLDAKIEATKLQLDAKIETTRLQLEAKIQEMFAKIHEVRPELIKWFVGIVGFQTLVLLGARLFMK